MILLLYFILNSMYLPIYHVESISPTELGLESETKQLLAKLDETKKILTAAQITLRETEHKIATLQASSNTGTAKLFLLMMAGPRFQNVMIWESFLKKAPVSQYQIIIHSTHHDEFIIPTPFKTLPFSLIPQYPSVYCKDLVTPMRGLIKAAVNSSTNSKDYFLFLSSDSIPLKPFTEIYRGIITYTARQHSRFCICPTDHWLDNKVKTHQWVGLTRSDAIVLDATTIPVWINDTRACIDEYWIYFVVRGNATVAVPSQGITLPSTVSQGDCYLYTWWWFYVPDDIHRIGMAHKDMSVTKKHVVTNIKTTYLSYLRNHPSFLFLRKVHGKDSNVFIPETNSTQSKWMKLRDYLIDANFYENHD